MQLALDGAIGDKPLRVSSFPLKPLSSSVYSIIYIQPISFLNYVSYIYHLSITIPYVFTKVLFTIQLVLTLVYTTYFNIKYLLLPRKEQLPTISVCEQKARFLYRLHKRPCIRI